MAFDHQVRKIPWNSKQQPAPGFLPRKFHGQRSLAGYSPWGRKVGHDNTAKQKTIFTNSQATDAYMIVFAISIAKSFTEVINSPQKNILKSPTT